MYCQKCGVELPEGSVFCGKCGYQQVLIDDGLIKSHSKTIDSETEHEVDTNKKSLKDVFEKREFNDASQANSYVIEAERKLKLSKIAIGFSLLALFFYSSSYTDFLNIIKTMDVYFALGLICTVIAYVLGGGFIQAVRVAGILTGLGFALPLPFFGNIMAGVICAIFSYIGIVFFSIAFVLINHISLRRNYKYAKEFLD